MLNFAVIVFFPKNSFKNAGYYSRQAVKFWEFFAIYKEKEQGFSPCSLIENEIMEPGRRYLTPDRPVNPARIPK